jgi:ribosomal protein L21E
MGKKRSRATQTSKGERRNVAKSTRKAARREYLANGVARVSNQMDAFLKGKRVMITIPNPNKKETNKPFIRIPAGEQWKVGKYSMKSGGQ